MFYGYTNNDDGSINVKCGSGDIKKIEKLAQINNWIDLKITEEIYEVNGKTYLSDLSAEYKEAKNEYETEQKAQQEMKELEAERQITPECIMELVASQAEQILTLEAEIADLKELLSK